MRTRLVVALSTILVIGAAVVVAVVGMRVWSSEGQTASSAVASATPLAAVTASPEQSGVVSGETPLSGETPSPVGSASATPTPTPTPVPTIPPPPTGLPENWKLQTERTAGGREADLIVRTGDIDNLGYGWPVHFTPFSGESTPAHPYPCTLRPGAAPGTDHAMLGSGVTEQDLKTRSGDGYSSCSKRPDNLPQAIPLAIGVLPPKVHAVFFQMFLDDFQPVVWHSHFQVALNGTRIPSFEDTINQLDQTGPVGKLLTLRLLPEYYSILRSGTVDLLVDDPTTGALDGYAVDFVRVLVNPHGFRYSVIIHCTVIDADTQKPIARASVSAAQASALTATAGTATLGGVPAGLVSVSASAVGYDSQVLLLDLPAGKAGTANFALHRHKENNLAALKQAIALTGSAAIYGIHFDTASAKLRPDSVTALETVLLLVKSSPGSRWTIAGHTDNQGGAAYNLELSDARATSVVTWLVEHGIAANRLVAKGYGLTRPVADNSTESGRALNRRVEVSSLR